MPAAFGPGIGRVYRLRMVRDDHSDALVAAPADLLSELHRVEGRWNHVSLDTRIPVSLMPPQASGLASRERSPSGSNRKPGHVVARTPRTRILALVAKLIDEAAMQAEVDPAAAGQGQADGLKCLRGDSCMHPAPGRGTVQGPCRSGSWRYGQSWLDRGCQRCARQNPGAVPPQ
jgi:hypothetical protein